MTTWAAASAFLLTVLGNSLWQGALIAAAAWLVLRTARGANATTRHAVLVAALLGVLVLPVLTTGMAFMQRPASGAAASSNHAAAQPLPRHATATLPGGHAAPPLSAASGHVVPQQPPARP